METKKKPTITAKTLTSLKEVSTRVKESGLLNKEELEEWERAMAKLREKWINKNM